MDQSGALSRARSELATALQRILDAKVDGTGASTLLPATVREQLLQSCRSMLDQIDSLKETDRDAIVVAELDARQLTSMLQQGRTDAIPGTVVAVIAERVISHNSGLLARVAAQKSIEDSQNEKKERGALENFALRYEVDATRERRSSRICGLGAAVALGAAGAVAYWTSSILMTDLKHPRLTLITPALVCGVLLIVSVILLITANKRERASREYVRLQRSFEGLEVWLNPLPDDARHLLRVTMTQSLFPRLLDDDDPMRHVAWPSDAAVLQSIYGVAADDLQPEVLESPQQPPIER